MRRVYTIGAPSIFVDKNGPGRYQNFGTRRSEVQILSPRPFFLSLSQSFTPPLLLRLLPTVFGTSVQLMATRTQIHTDLPSSAEHRVLFYRVIEVAHILPRLTHPALVQAPQDIPYSSAGTCAENDGTHGFRLCAFRRTDSPSSLASRILRDSSLGDYNDHDDHMVARGIR
jgi:hypothetical protein